jgi:hypothetical protein
MVSSQKRAAREDETPEARVLDLLLSCGLMERMYVHLPHLLPPLPLVSSTDRDRRTRRGAQARRPSPPDAGSVEDYFERVSVLVGRSVGTGMADPDVLYQGGDGECLSTKRK